MKEQGHVTSVSNHLVLHDRIWFGAYPTNSEHTSRAPPTNTLKGLGLIHKNKVHGQDQDKGFEPWYFGDFSTTVTDGGQPVL